MAYNCESCGASSGSNYNVPKSNCGCNSDNSCDTSNIKYTGPDLSCAQIETGTDLQTIIEALDALICEQSGINWNNFNYFCLDEIAEITTAGEFVEAISEQFCELKFQVESLTEETLPNEIENLQTQITAINQPNLTISCAGVISTDNYLQVLSKLGTKLCSINTAVNPSGANWTQCYSVSSAPTTVTSGFNLIIDWICGLKTQLNSVSLTLPTFNNATSCLPITGTTDTLYNTVVAIRNLLCTKPDFTPDSLNWQCVNTGDNLQETIQSIINTVSEIKEAYIAEVDETQFSLTPIDNENACAGFKLSLIEDLTPTDRFVASNAIDSSPGTLVQKLQAGTNITLSDTLNPGKITITAAGNDGKVKADSADTASGYLINKLDPNNSTDSAVVLVSSYNSTTDVVELTPSLNYDIIARKVLEVIGIDIEGDLKDSLCAITCDCECSSTTTTTTTALSRKVSGKITAVSDAMSSEYLSPTVQFTQLSPTVSWYGAAMTLNSGDIVNTGGYIVTTANSSVTGTVTVTNNHDTDELSYHIYVKDSGGTLVPGATNQTGVLSVGQSFTSNPFTYGTNANATLYVDLGNNSFS